MVLRMSMVDYANSLRSLNHLGIPIFIKIYILPCCSQTVKNVDYTIKTQFSLWENFEEFGTGI